MLAREVEATHVDGRVVLIIPPSRISVESEGLVSNGKVRMSPEEAQDLANGLNDARDAIEAGGETTVTIGIDVEITADTKDWRWDVSHNLNHMRIQDYVQDMLEIEGLPHWMEATIADIATKDVRSE